MMKSEIKQHMKLKAWVITISFKEATYKNANKNPKIKCGGMGRADTFVYFHLLFNKSKSIPMFIPTLYTKAAPQFQNISLKSYP